MIFPDLARAFDMLARERLFQSLANLNIPQDYQTLIQAWHTNTEYVVVHHEYEQHVLIERGVRQGCRAAPLLWTIFTVDLLKQLAALTDPTWVKSVFTLYADDIHAGQTVHDLSELDAYLCRIGVLFDLLEAAGLELGPGKLTAMLKIVGREHDHVQTRYTKRTKEGMVLHISP